jgi:hypothetical protein
MGARCGSCREAGNGSVANSSMRDLPAGTLAGGGHGVDALRVRSAVAMKIN